ncbi:hypothetical protein [Neogemmobacter tilapiae]|uniref:Uncharacterized protein n=1 Tax=Neogemmobacter tilapiae TaxID=875041 RepID=A0A918WJ39_9RHOB|nr:hypothetical protein [Gemmobacter tilapiae]GHC52219.1 hypothetical protein GCM10007315_13420 [Gemmobacter tilapiae]
MIRLTSALLLTLALALPAQAECYADYKAKQDDPLRLHYGVAKIADKNCDKGAAKKVLSKRLASEGWTLLNVLSIFGPEGLEERKASAGEYFLRF